MIANRVMFILSLAGAGVATYLTLSHIKVTALGCTAFSHGCDIVDASRYASGFGIDALSSIPTAAFGVAAYLAMAVFGFVRTVKPDGTVARLCSLGQFAMAASALGVAIWLTYLEAYVIHAWCQWCLTSAAITTLIFLTAGAERVFGRSPAAGAIRE
jgi:uncharacterized membrane protein